MLSVSRKQFTLEDYHRLADLGFFEQGERVELIRGDIIKMSPKSTPHSVFNSLLLESFYILLYSLMVLN